MFESEYLNDKKWGKGYDGNNNIIYDLKIGTGLIKEYDDNDQLRFGGKYMDGELNGIIKGYKDDGKLIEEEKYFKGKKNGRCKYYNDINF